MDPSREPFLRRSQQSILPSGQAYYTLESLEGAFLKPALPASLPRRESFPPPHPLERDALLRLDAQTRALLALAAEREALLRNLPGRATALPDQRMYADGLQALDARARVSLDGLQNLDPRARALLDNGRVLSHGLDARPGVVNISRALPAVGGIAPGATEHDPLSESLRGRELGVGAPFLTAADPTLGQRERDIWGAEVPDVGAQSSRLFANGSREPAATRSVPAESNKVKNQAERNKGLSNSKPSTAAAKINPPPEQSKGWCAVCKIECHNIETLGIHINGKKHKAVVEQLQGNTVKVEEASKAVDKVNSVPSTSQADKKRASDKKPETSRSAKRLKASTPVVTSNAPTAVATDVLINPSHQFCEICNIFTTGKTNLESHLKGKRHAARVRWNLKGNLRILTAT